MLSTLRPGFPHRLAKVLASRGESPQARNGRPRGHARLRCGTAEQRQQDPASRPSEAAGSRDAAAHARPGRLVPPAPPDSLPPRVTTPHARLSTRGCPVRRTDTHGFSLDSEGEHHRCVPDVTGCGPGARDSVCRATSQLCISWPFTSAPKRQNPVTALKQAPERTAGHSPTRWHGIRPRSPS